MDGQALIQDGTFRSSYAWRSCLFSNSQGRNSRFKGFRVKVLPCVRLPLQRGEMSAAVYIRGGVGARGVGAWPHASLILECPTGSSTLSQMYLSTSCPAYDHQHSAAGKSDEAPRKAEVPLVEGDK